MPKIIEQDGFRIIIWSNDHHPPHVHVFKGGAAVKIELVEPRVSKFEGKISNKDLAKALSLVIEYQVKLLERWKEIHE
jgi:Domain of unknown function (DUF4160)